MITLGVECNQSVEWLDWVLNDHASGDCGVEYSNRSVEWLDWELNDQCQQ